jgi:hypothetical protein
MMLKLKKDAYLDPKNSPPERSLELRLSIQTNLQLAMLGIWFLFRRTAAGSNSSLSYHLQPISEINWLAPQNHQ